MLTYTTASLTKHLNQKGETTMKSLAIEREFGSGGREIGMRVAELAGIPYYDGELLIKAAEAQGVSIELLKTYDEQRTGSFLYDIAAFSDYARNRKNTVYELFEGIRRTMVNIELKGPAVFIGRCSTVILGESPRVLKSFIYSSDTEKRVERIIRTENVSETDAKYLMQKKDRDRKNYFRFWTQKEWADKSKRYSAEYIRRVHGGMCPNASCCDKRPATEVIQHFQRPLCKSKRYQTYETFFALLALHSGLGCCVFCSRTVSTKVLVQSGSFPVAVLFI